MDVSSNRIFSISISLTDIEQLPEISVGNMLLNRNVDIQDNPIHCGCQIYDFIKFLKTGNNKLRFFTDNLFCHSPDHFKNQKITNLDYKNFACEIPHNNFSSNDVCDTCDCQFRPFQRSVFVNCSNKNLEIAPNLESIKDSLKIELDLKYNKITDFPDMRRTGYDKVELLNLSNNKITKLNQHIFNSSIQVKN